MVCSEKMGIRLELVFTCVLISSNGLFNNGGIASMFTGKADFPPALNAPPDLSPRQVQVCHPTSLPRKLLAVYSSKTGNKPRNGRPGFQETESRSGQL